MSFRWVSIFCIVSYKSLFFGKKLPRCCQKGHFSTKTTHFPLEITKNVFQQDCGKQRTISSHFTLPGSPQKRQKLLNYLQSQRSRYYGLLNIFSHFFPFGLNIPYSELITRHAWNKQTKDYQSKKQLGFGGQSLYVAKT